ILQIDAKNDDALRRIASMNEQIGAGPTRAASYAENNPQLADIASVSAIRRASTNPEGVPIIDDRRRKVSTAPPLSTPRTLTPPRPRGSQDSSPPVLAVSR